jgi:hypothetical protein
MKASLNHTHMLGTFGTFYDGLSPRTELNE